VESTEETGLGFFLAAWDDFPEETLEFISGWSLCNDIIIDSLSGVSFLFNAINYERNNPTPQ
jgi:hypothetical protein